MLSACVLAVGPLEAARDEWEEPWSTYRLTLEPAPGASAEALAGAFELFPLELDPRSCGFTIYDEAGKRVGQQVYWRKPGDPVKILFDSSSGSARYDVYVHAGNAPPSPHWDLQSGILLETRSFEGTSPMADLDQVRALWENGTTQGRGLVPAIFHGFNIFGPSENYLSSYRGYFRVEKDGLYSFATISDDASFLFIDGRPVAEWPGPHGADEGRHGQHNGNALLSKGVHEIRYLHAQGGGTTYACAAWKRPGEERFSIMPKTAFGPVAPFRVTGFETGYRSRMSACFVWSIKSSNTLEDGRSLVRAVFRAPPPPEGATCRWTFDDGSTSEGAMIEHLFPRSGLRRVTLEILAEEQRPRVAVADVAISRAWHDREIWTDESFQKDVADIARRNLTKLPDADLIALLRIADHLDVRLWLSKLGEIAFKRKTTIAAADADVFFALGRYYDDWDIRAYSRAEAAYRHYLELRADAADNETRQARLNLADLLANVLGQPGPARDILDALAKEPLTPIQKRRRVILDAEARLSQGETEAARDLLRGLPVEALGGQNDPVRASVRRNLLLRSAENFLQRAEWDAAAGILDDMIGKNPLERLTPDVGSALVSLHRGRRETTRAILQAERLLRVSVTANQRADLLFTLTELSLENGDDAAAARLQQQLAEKFPYSEAAARARDIWGDG